MHWSKGPNRDQITKGIRAKALARQQSGQRNPNWKGGRLILQDYVYIYKPGHPMAATFGSYIAEHRFVASQVLGRLLEDKEIVHHKNGVKHDNRPENLEVTTQSEHAKTHIREDGNPFSGRKHTRATKHKISLANTGRKWTMAQRECLLRLRKKPKTDKALAAVQRNLAKARRVYKRMRKSQK
jgi:hypothetical protein